MSTLTAATRRLPQPNPFEALLWVGVIAVEILLVFTYVTVRNAELGLFHVYPFIWINISAWVLWKIRPPSVGRQQQLLAGTIATAYFLILGFFGGLYGWVPFYDHPEQHLQYFEQMRGFDFALAAPPGYGPALFYTSPTLTLAITPYSLIGYLTLAYLVYVTVLDAADAAAPGIIGLFSCIGCTWPILASLVGGAGTSSALAASVYSQAYPLSTIAFVLTVALLYWRPFKR